MPGMVGVGAGRVNVTGDLSSSLPPSDSEALTRDPAVRALFAGPLETFTAERNALANAIKVAGDPERAAAVKQLKKPKVTAWVLNRLYAEEPELLTALTESGEAIREALALGAPTRLREAVAERRAAVDAAEQAAGALMLAHSKGWTDATRRRVRGSLDALATLGGAGRAHLGALVDDLEPVGFDALTGLAVAAPPAVAPQTPREPESAGGADTASALDDHAAARALAERQAAARATLIRAEAAAERAERFLVTANTERNQAAERARNAALERDEAERRVIRARQRAEETAVRSDEAERAEQAARAALEAARGALESARDAVAALAGETTG